MSKKIFKFDKNSHPVGIHTNDFKDEGFGLHNLREGFLNRVVIYYLFFFEMASKFGF